MSDSSLGNRWLTSERFLLLTTSIVLGALVAVNLGIVWLMTGQSPSMWIGRALDALLAVSSVQALWYVTRAAGLVAYLLLWLATAWGLAVASKIFDPVLKRPFTYDFHEFLSLLAIGFILLHIAVLLVDRYLPFTLVQILVPFTAPYRPVWVGVGVIAFYLTLLVTVTFYARRLIGTATFRMIHLASFLAYFGAAMHGLAAGTDSTLPTARLMYAGTTLTIVFLTTYWIYMAAWGKPRTVDLPGKGTLI